MLQQGTVDYEIIDSIPSGSEYLIRQRGNHQETPVGTLLDWFYQANKKASKVHFLTLKGQGVSVGVLEEKEVPKMNLLAFIDFKTWFPNIDTKVWAEIQKATIDTLIMVGLTGLIAGILGIALGVTLVCYA